MESECAVGGGDRSTTPMIQRVDRSDFFARWLTRTIHEP